MKPSVILVHMENAVRIAMGKIYTDKGMDVTRERIRQIEARMIRKIISRMIHCQYKGFS